MRIKKRMLNFALLKEWIQRNQIAVINTSVTISLLLVAIIVLLLRTGALQRNAVEEGVINLTGMTAYEAQVFYMSYFDKARTLAQIMASYQNIEVTQRRHIFNTIKLEILQANEALINVYSVWRPYGLDGLDAQFAGTPGHDETGQYISGFTRRFGPVQPRFFGDFVFLLGLSFEHLGLGGIISEPIFKDVAGTETWVVDVQVPIVDGEYIIGLAGVTINLMHLQNMIEGRSPHGGQTMISTSAGNILAHNDREMRGFSFFRPDPRNPLITNETFQFVRNSLITMEPHVFSSGDMLLVSYPLRDLDPITGTGRFDEDRTPSWAVITAVPVSAIMAPVNAMLLFSLFFIGGAGVLSGFVIFLTSRTQTRRTKILQQDLERATTMQDNVRYGLFMMDKNLIIQGAYSKNVEKILSVSELEGKKFIDVLSFSLKDDERESFEKYLLMFFVRRFDTALIKNINPYHEITYLSDETAEPKKLRTSFTLVERRKESFILGTIEDVSEEEKLRKQLAEAENVREKEVHALFQVIQLDPRVLKDFVDDAEFEFERINSIFKNRKSLEKGLLLEIYQYFHAIKSGALILNLDNISYRMNKLEGSIKTLLEEYDTSVPFSEFLELILEIESTMKEIDQIKATVLKIENFRSLSGGDQSQGHYVLVETLTRVCNKTQAVLNKKVNLVVEEIDERVLKKGPRRDIKEMLTQLIRNSVYHGIEHPDVRKSLGKKPEGEIRFSIKYKDNQIFIKFSDDGNGIDFEKIWQKAKKAKLIKEPVDPNDKNYLLQVLFLPGFSTLKTSDYHAGRGVGLTLVKDRLKNLRGKIKITTQQGKNTVFIITIPLEIETSVKKVS